MTVSCHTQWQRNACFWQFKLLPMEAMAHLLDKKTSCFCLHACGKFMSEGVGNMHCWRCSLQSNLNTLQYCVYIYISIYLSVCLSACLSVYLSIYQSIDLSIYLSVCVRVYVYIYICDMYVVYHRFSVMISIYIYIINIYIYIYIVLF